MYPSEQAVQSALRFSLCPKIGVRCGDRLQTLHDPAAPHCRMASIAEVLSRLPRKSTTAAMDMAIETLLLLGGKPGRQAHREMLTPPHIAISVAKGLKRLHFGATGALLLSVVWTSYKIRVNLDVQHSREPCARKAKDPMNSSFQRTPSDCANLRMHCLGSEQCHNICNWCDVNANHILRLWPR